MTFRTLTACVYKLSQRVVEVFPTALSMQLRARLNGGVGNGEVTSCQSDCIQSRARIASIAPRREPRLC